MQLSLYVTGMVDGGKMYFDAVTISAICDELNRKLLGGRVQAIIEMDQLTLGLEMYAMHARHYLVMSAHPQRARVLLSDEKVRRGRSNSSPLGLLMKKYLIGGRLESILQPSYERVIQFDFSGEEGDVSLVAEIMDNRSNIILMLDGAILESIKHVTRDMNRYREIIPKNTTFLHRLFRKKSLMRSLRAGSKGLSEEMHHLTPGASLHRRLPESVLSSRVR